jgi:hypothetical protein
MNRRLIALAESPDARFWRADYQELSVPERIFRIIWELEGEVNNGGLDQYFFNSSGSLVPDVVDALKTIGAFRMAGILEDAIRLMPTNVSWRDSDMRREVLIALPEASQDTLDTLTKKFYDYPDDLTALLYAYVCDHRTEVGAAADF